MGPLPPEAVSPVGGLNMFGVPLITAGVAVLAGLAGFAVISGVVSSTWPLLVGIGFGATVGEGGGLVGGAVGGGVVGGAVGGGVVGGADGLGEPVPVGEVVGDGLPEGAGDPDGFADGEPDATGEGGAPEG